jgi:hypothetical protein
MSRYASSTSVSAEKSRAEIERDLRRYGADQFMSGWDKGGQAILGFRFNGRMIRMLLSMPDPKAREFTHTPSRGTRRREDDAAREWEQACRQRWRALALVIKAKLEAVTAGITTFEDEFLAFTMLPDGTTVNQWIGPKLLAAYDKGEMPKALLPGLRVES